MAGNYDEITKRPDDKERLAAFSTGVGGYGGEDQKNPELRQKSLPKDES